MSLEDARSLKIALRVLTAITEYAEPLAADIEKLRMLAPEYSLRAPDEIACEVVRRSLQMRAEMVAA